MRRALGSVLVSATLGLGLSGSFGCSGEGGSPAANGANGGDAASSGGHTASSGSAGGHTASSGGAGGDAASSGGAGGDPLGAGGNGTNQAGAGNGGESSGSSSSSGDATHLTAKIILPQVPPGQEEHVCVIVALPNETATWATEVHATLGEGSHHLIVDRREPGSALQAVPEQCTPTMADNATRLMIAQQKETAVTLPRGVAFKIAPRQPLFLQLHYINTGSRAEDIEGTVTLTLADATAAAPTEAHSVFTGQLSLDLPPHAPSSFASYFVPEAPSGTRRVFAVTSHTHSLGVDSTIERVASEKAPPTTPIHESVNWDEPPLTSFNPPLAFAGKDGLRLTCKYMNTTDKTVTFGTGFHDEMCFMWVYYYDE
jgi:hypothetical protein